ncbi:MAG: D-alanyl-D-alanine dipeptidase [Phycisphaerae bacterium]
MNRSAILLCACLLYGCGQARRAGEPVAVFTELPPGEEPLVDVRKIDPRIRVAIPYVTADNFTGRALYPANLALLRTSVARRLSAVQDELARLKLGLKVLDAYRPWSIQCLMWEAVPDENYVADPNKGSRHNRGAAVDVTLVDANGNELEMPSRHDEFTERSRADYKGGSAASRRNRD